PTGRSTTNSVLASAISDGRLVMFQIRGILGFSFGNNTHGCDTTSFALLIVRPPTRLGWAPPSNAAKL
ncbi:hypothetical protein, partial [Streptococcus pneumoniae]